MYIAADPYFVKMLRDEVGLKNLDLVFDFHKRRYPDNGLGCWKVTMRNRYFAPVPSDVGEVYASVEIDDEIFVLDGIHGTPITPGRWLIDALCESDKVRHPEREDFIEEWREEKVAAKHRARKASAKEVAQDTMLYRNMKKFAEERGTSSLTTVELVELERQAIEKQAAVYEADLIERKKARMGKRGDAN